MNDRDELVQRLFLRLNQSQFQLGLGEYLAALSAVEGGFGQSLEELEDTLKLLWCHSLAEQSQFEPLWQLEIAQISPRQRRKPPFPGGRKSGRLPPSPSSAATPRPSPPTPHPLPLNSPPKAETGVLPVQAPSRLTMAEEPLSLQAYYPISRRSMVYNWRYLRRPVADGPQDVLDVAATIQQVSRQGFYLTPVYRRRSRNQARLLLLVDQNGSMTPFHHFTRALVETARDTGALEPDNVSAFYFQNVPMGSLYRDTHLTKPVGLRAVLNSCDGGTSVLIVSDAGAGRGYRTKDRIRGSIRFLTQLRRYTTLIAWLNPMPQHRWVGSSADVIANAVPMFQMDNEGLGNAIDVIRGQPLTYPYSSSL
ncbi:VWA domain-containing protein [Nodosilinea sp. PGN35]|uniref:VWA domain-containing protein n=1 Tax=Nodosilinea sp. PGN35 TaxID=3020489 RepID=UPI0023B2AFFC|nr:VWA domain-containing protein [Nodosilinea sp. TSF1-S3]MDF0368502.1 VWA domain-containing protein [Nodosilinea sp. TSF1-S3]